MAALAAATSMPNCASFAMPDAIDCLDILIIVLVTRYWDQWAAGPGRTLGLLGRKPEHGPGAGGGPRPLPGARR